jgi:hypothetical protein
MAQFRAVQAETREDRARKADKESLEKSRLVERREKFTRYENQGPPTLPAPNALGFMTDANRFHSDTAGEEKEVTNCCASDAWSGRQHHNNLTTLSGARGHRGKKMPGH